jgi:hypothetical protein
MVWLPFPVMVVVYGIVLPPLYTFWRDEDPGIFGVFANQPAYHHHYYILITINIYYSYH